VIGTRLKLMWTNNALLIGPHSIQFDRHSLSSAIHWTKLSSRRRKRRTSASQMRSPNAFYPYSTAVSR
jgi:hypothetical protein